jgi:hypothetical protein
MQDPRATPQGSARPSQGRFARQSASHESTAARGCQGLGGYSDVRGISCLPSCVFKRARLPAPPSLRRKVDRSCPPPRRLDQRRQAARTHFGRAEPGRAAAGLAASDSFAARVRRPGQDLRERDQAGDEASAAPGRRQKDGRAMSGKGTWLVRSVRADSQEGESTGGKKSAQALEKEHSAWLTGTVLSRTGAGRWRGCLPTGGDTAKRGGTPNGHRVPHAVRAARGLPGRHGLHRFRPRRSGVIARQDADRRGHPLCGH